MQGLRRVSFFSSVALWRFDGSVSSSHRLSVPSLNILNFHFRASFRSALFVFERSESFHKQVSDATLNSSNVWFDPSGQRNSARTTPQYQTNMFIVGAPQTQATLVTRMSGNPCAMQNFSVCAKRTLHCNQTNRTENKVESYWSEAVIRMYNPKRQRSSSKHALRFGSIRFDGDRGPLWCNRYFG